MKRGVVVGLNRANQLAQVQLLAGPVVQAAWLDAPPCPRSQVWLSDVSTGGAGAFLVMGTVGRRDYVFHDDFCVVLGGSVNWSATGNFTVNGDTAWRAIPRVANVNSGTFEGAAQGVGACSLVTGSTATGQFISLAKGGTATGDTNAGQMALWFSGRWLSTDYSSMSATFGFANDSGDLGAKASGDRTCMFLYDSPTSANFLFQTGVDATTTNTNTGVAATNSVWYDVDIVMVPGSWAAAWINGVGPFVNRANVPAPNIVLPVQFAVYNQTVAQRGITVDYARLELVSPVVAP